MNEKLDIVIFNMSAWTDWEKRGISNRNRHLIEAMIKNTKIGKIICVDFLPFSFKKVIRVLRDGFLKGIKGRVVWRRLFTSIIEHPDYPEKVYVVSNVSSWWSQSALTRTLEKFLVKIDITKPIVWSCNPMSIKTWLDLSSSFKIFDAIDIWIEHPSYKKYVKRLEKNYQIIKDKSDVIFTVAKNTIDFFGDRKNVYWVANGVDLDRFVIEPKLDIPENMKSLPQPIVGYIGTIQDRLDLNLVKFLAQNNPQVSFACVGGIWPKTKKRIDKEFVGINNVYWLGRVKYQDAPAYIQNFSTLIIPHLLDRFIKYTDPMKLYLALACGVPAVSTPAPIVDELESVVYLADNYEEFNQQLQKALSESKDPLWQKRRRDAVQGYSWDKRFNVMLEKIEENNDNLTE